MPFAWTLSLGDGDTQVHVRGTDVSDWLEFGIQDTPQVRIEFAAGTVQTAGPGDYRDTRAITESIRAYREEPKPRAE